MPMLWFQKLSKGGVQAYNFQESIYIKWIKMCKKYLEQKMWAKILDQTNSF